MDLEGNFPCITVHKDLKDLYEDILHMRKSATLIAQSAFSSMLDDVLLNEERSHLWHTPFLKWCDQLIQESDLKKSISTSPLQNLEALSNQEIVSHGVV
jgi:hypothetical protein